MEKPNFSTAFMRKEGKAVGPHGNRQYFVSHAALLVGVVSLGICPLTITIRTAHDHPSLSKMVAKENNLQSRHCL